MGMFSSNLIFFDPNQRTQDRISVSIVELESGATMTEELRVIIFIALGLSGVIGVWLSALWVAGGVVLP
jgi:sensor c-di-GMP phosphodiesterase-like protein